MPGLEPGAICIKTRGREAGKKAILLEYDPKTGMATIEGPKVKKRKCNIKHLLPTGKKIQLKKTAKRKEIAEMLKQVE